MNITRRKTLFALSALPLSTLSFAKIASTAWAETATKNIDLSRLDGFAQVELIKSGQISARELVEAALVRIEKLNPQLNAFVDVQAERALEKAAGVVPNTPFAGLPYALKDMNEYPGMVYERGSALFKGAKGQKVTPYTQKIDDTGVVILGKTATPEFGLLPTTEPVAYKNCKNPWNLAHSTGGSSGGAAAAVAARIIPIAQASDGAGSIRNPACMCGIYGLKPSRGRFPEQGNAKRDIELSIKHAVSLSVRDNALMLALTEAKNGPLTPVGLVTPGKVAPKRIAMTINDITGAAPHPAVAQAVEKAAKTLQELGHNIELVEAVPGIDPDLFDDFLVLWGESVLPITKYAESVAGKPVRETGLLEGWTMDLAENYQSMDANSIKAAMQRLKLGGGQLTNWLQGYDAWLTPSISMPAPKLGWTYGDLPMKQNFERARQLVAHLPLHNLAGTPGASIPFGFSDGLPIGIQLSAALGNERTILELSYQLEEARPWIHQLPPIVAE